MLGYSHAAPLGRALERAAHFMPYSHASHLLTIPPLIPPCSSMLVKESADQAGREQSDTFIDSPGVYKYLRCQFPDSAQLFCSCNVEVVNDPES